MFENHPKNVCIKINEINNSESWKFIFDELVCYNAVCFQTLPVSQVVNKIPILFCI
jgi:hypothetical protein